MATRRGAWIAWALGWSLGVGCGGAQALAQSSPQTAPDALHAMTELAGVIFAGQVVAVRWHGAADGAAGVVEITFAVDDAVRGVRGASGGSYTLREWAGLWPGGDEPFRVGQRYLMLLHSPGTAGLSSPVGGMDGAIPIRGGNANAAGPAADGLSVDLSWVGTRAVRPIAYVPAQGRGPIARPIAVQREVKNAAASAEGIPASGQPNVSYAAVLAMVHGWERVDHGSH